MIDDELALTRWRLEEMNQDYSDVIAKLPVNDPQLPALTGQQDQVRLALQRIHELSAALANLEYQQALTEMDEGLEALKAAKEDLDRVEWAIKMAAKALAVPQKLLSLFA